MKRTTLSLLALAWFHLGSPNGAHAGQPVRRDRVNNALEASIDHLPRKAAPAMGLSPAEPMSVRPVAIGFAANHKLHDAVRERVRRAAGYRVDPSQQIPADPTGLFVGGRLADMKASQGWMECRVKYLVASQPGPAVMLVETVAASVPILPGSTPAQRKEAVEIAEAGCLSEMAQQITNGLQQSAR